VEQRALDISIERYEIMTYSIEVTKDNLPWNNGKSV
jgi:hypothetical protein